MHYSNYFSIYGLIIFVFEYAIKISAAKAILSRIFSPNTMQYHNNISERMLRAFAEARKVLYGSRTKKGADRTAIMMSVHATCNMRGINFYDFAQECLAGKTTVLPEKSVVQTCSLCISCLTVLHCRIEFWELHALWQQKSCSITVSALMQGMIL